MNKYGVDVGTDGTKVSEDLKVKTKCSRCGETLEVDANVPTCPKCGTEPVEREAP